MNHICFESFDNITQSGKCDTIDINISAGFIGDINLNIFSKKSFKRIKLCNISKYSKLFYF